MEQKAMLKTLTLVSKKDNNETGHLGLHIEVDGYNHTFIVTEYEAELLRNAIERAEQGVESTSFNVRDVGYFLSLGFRNYRDHVTMTGTIIKYSSSYRNCEEEGNHYNVYKQIWLGDTAEMKDYEYIIVSLVEVDRDSLV